MIRYLTKLRRWRGTVMPAAALMVLTAFGSSDGPERSTNRTVVIHMTDDMRFGPEHPNIAVGDTVVWVNDGQMPHTSTNEPPRAALNEHNILPDGTAPWDSGFLNHGERYRRVFEVPGEYAYLCVLHEGLGMVGYLTVQPATERYEGERRRIGAGALPIPLTSGELASTAGDGG